MSLQRKPAWQTLSKALDIWSATAQVTPENFKPLAILSNTFVRRAAADREDLKLSCNGNRKKGHISQGEHEQAYYLQLFPKCY